MADDCLLKKKIVQPLPTGHPRGGSGTLKSIFEILCDPYLDTKNCLRPNPFMHSKGIEADPTVRVLFLCQTLITRPCPYYKAPFMEQ